MGLVDLCGVGGLWVWWFVLDLLFDLGFVIICILMLSVFTYGVWFGF